MKRSNYNHIKKLQIILLTIALLVPSMGHAIQSELVRKDSPGGLAIIGDAVIARPWLFAATAIGSGLFVATLPFSALGGNVKETGNMLVMVPANAAFLRCLGCTPIQNEKNKTRRKQEIAKGGVYK